MRPGLNKEIVRENTAYRVGRVAVDILLLLQWIGTVLLLVVFFNSVPTLKEQAGLMSFALAVSSAVLGSLLGLALRELAHAVFDMADRALLNQKPPGTSENPFGA